ncbi:MAG: R.Pab1 family restriction endonuclease [Candidatus Campbellbacteria bacterium]|nr:R.Pab1 family restriction endonuclease [Candidatus Campbellbacteria bacterium]
MIKISLPLTKHTGKARVKYRKDKKDYGIPFATRQNKLTQDNYIEWQIGYDTKEKKLSKSKFSFQRKGETKYTFELSEYLIDAIKNNLVTKEEFKELKKFVEKARIETAFIEERFNIKREEQKQMSLMGVNFDLFMEHYPLLLYFQNKDEYSIEVKIDRKQKAIGVQAMLFLCIPITRFEEKKGLIVREAEQNEQVTLEIKRNKNNFIIDVIKIFAISSSQHNEDIKNIIDTIEKNI